MSKNRQWYPRCKRYNKIRYPNERIANLVLVQWIKTGKPDPGMHAYYCTTCYGWHLGSTFKSLERVSHEEVERGY